MLKDETLLVFGEDYGRHPHCLEHIVNELAVSNNVFWVETIGMRSPRLTVYDMKRTAQLIFKWSIGQYNFISKQRNKNIKIISIPMLPYTSFKLIRRLNKFLICRKVRRELTKAGVARPILITSVPSVCDFVKIFDEKLTVYYCVDEFSLWPGISYDRIKAMESELLAKSDLIFTTSSRLTESKKTSGKVPHLLTHGVSLAHFSLPEQSNVEYSRKKICYFGLIDERCDQELLITLARAIPDALLTIIGEAVCDISGLHKCSNIMFQGRVTYENLPGVIKDQDYFILPYYINELTENINPLKIKEYMATGRPVISTPLPEVVKLGAFVYIADSHEKFVYIIKGLITGLIVHTSTPALNYLKQNETWKSKATLMSAMIKKAMLSKELVMKQL
ncbi:MAG: hypothetical protein A2X86_13935 [Bdellovibrionales bacterium GWA2_49_15]|nr:MAG: hypothetical protein A2X86_13935 [Bdellovibrionales bacterium GWA2_49_15]